MKNKIILNMLAFVILFTTTGCWDQHEVDELAIVIGLGVDKVSGNNPVQITAQIANPASAVKTESTTGKPYVVMTAKGKTVLDAVQNFTKESPRKIFLSHNYVVVFGEEMARNGIEGVLDYFERDPLFRRTSWVLVTNKTGKEVMETEIPLQKFPAIGIKNMIKQSKDESLAKVINWEDFISTFENRPTCAVATRIDITENKATKKLEINGTALFYKDKLKGFLNAHESEGLLWALGEINIAKAGVNCPNNNKGSVMFQVQETKHSINPYYKEDKLLVDLNVQTESTIAEINKCKNLNISDQQILNQLERMQEKALEKQIKDSIKKIQGLGTDPLEFGEAFRKKDPQKWKLIKDDWTSHFKELKVNIQVDSKVKFTGTKSEPVIIND
ncbi:Ger(x)C family spore germination protein [Fictibacillus barbaricus]|uniref:Ger(X)C family spore germination protein n=1 Tax=Fictibacillus barbaricus TaxID=182136 RepID=A0ABS2ZBN1_9BACL|nr:Ger(x)C family spore germination protein [Fictibacillus barbaricus]MBN3544145.1 Ger(x)C family spore germination protein [Fictibacillus barbaricus]GGB69292.1 hypothetical protein GCM10007199_39380 [Fictibacillus barbaricus]